MEVIIRGKPKEIAALALAVQEQIEYKPDAASDEKEILQSVINYLADKP